MQLACFEKDYWQLRNGEESNRKSPNTFWIPSLDKRKSLRVGDSAKLILEIESEKEDGSIVVEGERGFVIVSKVVGEKYLGILDFQPACVEKGNEDVYLCFGAEIPFSYEHIVDINRPPEDYIEWQLGQKPERVWYRK